MPRSPSHADLVELTREEVCLSNALVLLLAVLLTPSTALAYLDPGTGSLLVQAVIGGIAALAVFFRQTWIRLWHRLRGRQDPPAGSPPRSPVDLGEPRSRVVPRPGWPRFRERWPDLQDRLRRPQTRARRRRGDGALLCASRLAGGPPRTRLLAPRLPPGMPGLAAVFATQIRPERSCRPCASGRSLCSSAGGRSPRRRRRLSCCWAASLPAATSSPAPRSRLAAWSSQKAVSCSGPGGPAPARPGSRPAATRTAERTRAAPLRRGGASVLGLVLVYVLATGAAPIARSTGPSRRPAARGDAPLDPAPAERAESAQSGWIISLALLGAGLSFRRCFRPGTSDSEGASRPRPGGGRAGPPRGAVVPLRLQPRPLPQRRRHFRRPLALRRAGRSSGLALPATFAAFALLGASSSPRRQPTLPNGSSGPRPP